MLKEKYEKANNFYINYNEYGKPFIFGLENFHFNISHSGSYIVLGYANKDVGVDIEGVNNNNPRIVDRFFHKNEKDFIKSMKIIFFKNQAFLRLWTLKESYLKAIGFGINYPLNNFSVVSSDRKIISSLNNYSFKQYYISIKYKLTICSMENLFSKKLKYISYKKLIKACNKYSK